MQRKLIYLPEIYSPQVHQKLVSTAKLQYWPSANEYRALIKQQTDTQYHGTVLVFHGNAGSAVNRLHYFNALETNGYRIIIAEYPGYGSRPGKQSESLLIEDGVTPVQRVYQQFGGPLFLAGESLGAGVVSGIIAKQAVPIQGVILIAPFDNLPSVAQSHYWWVMAKWLTLDQFNNINNLKQYTGKIAVVMAEQDKIIPNKHTLKLFKAITSEKRLWKLEDSDHNDWPGSSNQQWWLQAMEFIEF